MEEQTIELATVVQNWHKKRMDQLEVLRGVEEGTELRFDAGSTDVPPLSGREADLFRLGMITGMDMFKALPFTLERNETDDDDDLDDDLDDDALEDETHG